MTSTFRLKQRNKYSEYPLRHLEIGIGKVKSVLLGITVDPDTVFLIKKTYALLLASVHLFRKRGKSPTVVLVPKNKIMTLNDNRIFLDMNTLLTTWLQTSVLDLIGKGKDLKPFWSKQCDERSKLCWLSTETDSVDSPLISSNSSWSQTGWNSLSSMTIKMNPEIKNSQKTFYPSSMFIHAGEWDKEDTRCRQIRLYPTNEQKKKLRQWIGTTRYLYNKALFSLKKKESNYNFQDLRNKFVTSKGNKLEDWELETPKDIRAGAMKDLTTAFKAAMTNLRRKNISKFNLGWRTKKKEASISLPSSSIKLNSNKLTIYSSYGLGQIRVSKDRSLSSLSINHDCRLGKKNGDWYLYVPVKIKPQKRKSKFGTCALDPGVRKFHTIYSEEMVSKIPIRKEIIKKYQNKLDILNSLRSKKIIKRNHYTRAQKKVYKKLSFLTDDLHYKTIDFLVNNYSTVIIPIFESQEIASKSKNRNCNRNLLQLKHYRFRQRLKDKFVLIKNTGVLECTEEFTSKTCTQCGIINNKLGSSEFFKCESCGLEIDRDINGARNIYLKVLSEHKNTPV